MGSYHGGRVSTRETEAREVDSVAVIGTDVVATVGKLASRVGVQVDPHGRRQSLGFMRPWGLGSAHDDKPIE